MMIDRYAALKLIAQGAREDAEQIFAYTPDIDGIDNSDLDQYEPAWQDKLEDAAVKGEILKLLEGCELSNSQLAQIEGLKLVVSQISELGFDAEIVEAVKGYDLAVSDTANSISGNMRIYIYDNAVRYQQYPDAPTSDEYAGRSYDLSNLDHRRAFIDEVFMFLGDRASSMTYKKKMEIAFGGLLKKVQL